MNTTRHICNCVTVITITVCITIGYVKYTENHVKIAYWNAKGMQYFDNAKIQLAKK